MFHVKRRGSRHTGGPPGPGVAIDRRSRHLVDGWGRGGLVTRRNSTPCLHGRLPRVAVCGPSARQGATVSRYPIDSSSSVRPRAMNCSSLGEWIVRKDGGLHSDARRGVGWGSRESDGHDWAESSRGSDPHSHPIRMTIASRISHSREFERVAGDERRSAPPGGAGALTRARDPDTGREARFTWNVRAIPADRQWRAGCGNPLPQPAKAIQAPCGCDSTPRFM